MSGQLKGGEDAREADERVEPKQHAAQSLGATSRRSPSPNPDRVEHQPRTDRSKLDADGNNKSGSSHADGETTDSSQNDCYNDDERRASNLLRSESGERRPDPPVLVSPGIVEFSLESIREQLTCRLCGGYFRDPYTLTKCLHTFCKSCLIVAFANTNYECPTCRQYLGQNLQKCALADRVLQNLIDKVLFPEMARLDRLDEEAFYEKLGLERKPAGPEASKAPAVQSPAPIHGKRKEKSSDTHEGSGAGAPLKRSKRSHPSAASTDDRKPPPPSEPASSSLPSSEVVFRLVPHRDDPALPLPAAAAAPALQNPYLRTSGSLRVGQIKKYLRRHLNLRQGAAGAGAAAEAPPATGESSAPTAAAAIAPSDPAEALEVLCHGVPLGNELSVRFAQRAVWLAPSSAGAGAADGSEGAARGGPGADRHGDVLTLTYRVLRAP